MNHLSPTPGTSYYRHWPDAGASLVQNLTKPLLQSNNQLQNEVTNKLPNKAQCHMVLMASWGSAITNALHLTIWAHMSIFYYSSAIFANGFNHTLMCGIYDAQRTSSFMAGHLEVPYLTLSKPSQFMLCHSFVTFLLHKIGQNIKKKIPRQN